MAPSVEVNCGNNLHLNSHTKEKLFSDIKTANGQGNKLKCENTKEVVEERTRTYRTEKQFSSRKEEAAAIRNKFPTKIPIIVDRFHKECSLPPLERSKFLVPQEITMSQFVTIIRHPDVDERSGPDEAITKDILKKYFVLFWMREKLRNRMKLGSNQAFYLLINNRSMLSLSKTLAEVYNDHKEEDGFLYMTYASQEVFG